MTERLAKEGADAVADFWGRRLVKTILALELTAEEYDAAGQTDKVAQISMVPLKHAK